MGKFGTFAVAVAAVLGLGSLGVLGVVALFLGVILLNLSITAIIVKLLSYVLFKLVAVPLLSWKASFKFAAVLFAVRWAVGYVFSGVSRTEVATS